MGLLDEMVCRRIAQIPDSVVIAHGDVRLSYGELGRRASLLGRTESGVVRWQLCGDLTEPVDRERRFGARRVDDGRGLHSYRFKLSDPSARSDT